MHTGLPLSLEPALRVAPTDQKARQQSCSLHSKVLLESSALQCTQGLPLP